MKQRKIAVFDIDGTIFRSSLLIELVEALILGGVFPSRARKTYEQAYQNWLDRKEGYDKYIGGVVRAFDENIKGVSEKKFLKVADMVVHSHKNRVYRYTRDLVRELKRKRYYLLAVSNSPKHVVDKFAKKLGFHKVYGRMLAVDRRGRFTGELMFPDLIREKKNIVARVMEQGNFTLTGSVGVGDSEADISFLRLVERPICFNPNDILYRAARRNHWEVVVERKNVVYRFAAARTRSKAHSRGNYLLVQDTKA